MEIFLGVDEAGGGVFVDLDTHLFGLIVGGTENASTVSAAYASALSAGAAAARRDELEIWRISPQGERQLEDVAGEISCREHLLHEAEQADFASYNNWCRDHGGEPLPLLLIQVEGFPDLLDGYRSTPGVELARVIAKSQSVGLRIQLFSGFVPYRQTPDFLCHRSYLVMLHTDVHTSERMLGDRSAAELDQSTGLVALDRGKRIRVQLASSAQDADSRSAACT